MSIEETAKFLGIDRQQMYQLLKNGQINVNKVNGHQVVSQGGLLDYLARTRPKH